MPGGPKDGGMGEHRPRKQLEYDTAPQCACTSFPCSRQEDARPSLEEVGQVPAGEEVLPERWPLSLAMALRGSCNCVCVCVCVCLFALKGFRIVVWLIWGLEGQRPFDPSIADARLSRTWRGILRASHAESRGSAGRQTCESPQPRRSRPFPYLFL